MKKNLNTLQDWLDWQQTLHPLNIDFKLERIKSVYNKLDIQDIAKKVIIVAGTNGKGSTVAILESILHESKKSVGTFTSPHITSYNERIRFNKQEVKTSDLIDTFKMMYFMNMKDGGIFNNVFQTTICSLLPIRHSSIDLV